MSVIWNAPDAVTATGGNATQDFEITGVSIDTRTIQKGDLFVALKAARDGHDFVAQALTAGAAAALVTHIPENAPQDAAYLIVDDVLKALENLGAAARARVTGKVIGITGSVGKTSTKEMLRAILERQGKCHAAEASYNNHWGVPLTLARMPADTDFAVIEIGMSNPGEIAPLSCLARPDVAMITTVAPAHMAAFENLEGIAHEKAAIFDGLETGGIAVINGDLDVTPILQAAWRGDTVIFGENPDCDVRLNDVELADGITNASASIGNMTVEFSLSTAGRHFANNGAGCLAVVAAIGADVAQAAADLVHWFAPEGRGARENITLPNGAEISLIDDAFNANPTSMSAALEVLASATPKQGGRRVAILGDMLELGASEQKDHADLAALSWINAIDCVHASGPLMAHLMAELCDEKTGQWCEDATQLRGHISSMIAAGDVVLVKGSKGSKISLLVDAIRELGHPQSKNIKQGK